MSRSDQDEKNRIPGIMIAAVGSGSGKTLITCALLHIFKQNNINPASFKCGPDYIDPMFHKKMLGVPSRNLDVFLSGRDGIMQVLRKGMRDSDLAVIEGVMGFFDGISASSSEGSSCDIARITGIPVILVVNCRGMSRSIIPIIKGFAGYDGGCSIKGVILNNISDTLFDKIREDVIRETGLPVIAHLPHMEDAVFRSRHLGLLMPDEITDMHERTVRAAEQLDKRLDIKKLLLLCTGDASVMPPEIITQDAITPENITPDAIMPGDMPKEDMPENMQPYAITTDAITPDVMPPDAILRERQRPEVKRARPGSDRAVRIGIARDEAFCFYYEDNIELIKELGAEIVFFSPLTDEHIPDVTGLILGGGYPELFAGTLSENISMLESIRRAAAEGMPILAECGGFLYLQEYLEDPDKKTYPMAGIFKGRAFMTDRLRHFGYVEVIAKEDMPYLKAGEKIRGHEFHYYDTTGSGEVFEIRKPSGDRSWKGYKLVNNALGGFAHLYYPSKPDFIRRFLGRDKD